MRCLFVFLWVCVLISFMGITHPIDWLRRIAYEELRKAVVGW